MKKENRITSKRFKMMVGICAVLMGLTVIMSGMIKGTLGSVNEAAILYFENLDTICEIYVNAGTAQEDLGLPPSLRAIIKTVSDDPADNEFESGGIINESENGIEIEGDEIADEKGFRQTEPRIGDDGEYNYGRHGYIAPENEYYLRETDQLVIYTLYYADGSKAYRVHGSYGGNNEGFYACSEYGNIIGIISDIPVTWEGEYDGSVPGTYILTARAANFDYSGVMPVAVIKVAQEETKEPDTEPAPVPYENSEEPPEAEETDDYATPESGRISGFLRTDFGEDGFYNEEIQPLANYTVYLYASDDLTIPVDEIQTAVDGTYEFSGLEPGGYVLGLASEASETVNDGEYLLPDTVTDDNKFAIDYESDPLMAYTEIIELDEGMAVEDINAGLMLSISLLRASPDEYTIDLSTVTNNSKGTGWTCSDITAANSGTAGKINFNKDASGNKYTIVKSVTGNAITRDIIINPDVSDITVTYVGDNIQMNKVGTPSVYYPFNSTVTINGGGNNSVVYE